MKINTIKNFFIKNALFYYKLLLIIISFAKFFRFIYSLFLIDNLDFINFFHEPRKVLSEDELKNKQDNIKSCLKEFQERVDANKVKTDAKKNDYELQNEVRELFKKSTSDTSNNKSTFLAKFLDFIKK
jgi:hypothetical protein